MENSGISHIKWQLKTLSGLYALTPHMHIATGVHIAGEIPKTVDNDIEFFFFVLVGPIGQALAEAFKK